MEDIEIYMRDKYEYEVENMIGKLINLCRHTQREYIKGTSDVSGVDVLKIALDKGGVSISNFISILPAIEYYDTEYNLNIKK